jgi:hypothetical protein
METKELEQLLCDYFASSDEISVNARWLQDELKTIAAMKRDIESLINKNDILRAVSVIREYDCPKYRLNIKG